MLSLLPALTREPPQCSRGQAFLAQFRDEHVGTREGTTQVPRSEAVGSLRTRRSGVSACSVRVWLVPLNPGGSPVPRPRASGVKRVETPQTGVLKEGDLWKLTGTK